MKIEDLPRPANYRRQMAKNGGYEMVPAYTAEEVLGILEGVEKNNERWEQRASELVNAFDVVKPTKDQRIVLNWQGRVDGTVEAFEMNGMMFIGDPEGVTYITREQAAEFFGFC